MSSRLQTQVKTAPKLSLTPARTDHMQRHAEYRKELQILEGLSTNPQEPFTVPPIKKVLRPGSQSIGTAVTASFEPRFGHNFGRVRVHTALPEITQTRLRASQSEDEQEEEATQPAQQVLEIPEPAAQEGTEPTDLAPGATGPAVNEIQTPARAEPTTGTAVTDDTRSPGLLVEDSVDELGPGQMKKSEFLDELHTVVCSAAEAALASTGRSAQGCPYLDYWFDLYRTKDSAHIERAIRRYAPEASGVATARDYIPLITERILRAISVWANTGEITGVPEGVPTNLNDMGTVGKSGGTPGNSGSTVIKDHDSSTWDAENSLTIRSQLGSGRPLDNGVKSRMESAFRHDFSHVRIHTDIKAAELSNRFSA